MRQLVFCGGFDLAAIFAQLRRDAIELELAVDLVFGRARDALVIVEAKQPVLAEREPHLERGLGACGPPWRGELPSDRAGGPPRKRPGESLSSPRQTRPGPSRPPACPCGGRTPPPS